LRRRFLPEGECLFMAGTFDPTVSQSFDFTEGSSTGVRRELPLLAHLLEKLIDVADVDRDAKIFRAGVS
jgi:hypothetical protein